ncbi:hypothetical protein IQ07DRAFT_588251 [Pyrenochaeta sp. DS3sAY3a]|nr:hypothetical protein IQ07DRAFT_588251 [Pyrenochaeta sp. DS3sAY3a]
MNSNPARRFNHTQNQKPCSVTAPETQPKPHRPKPRALAHPIPSPQAVIALPSDFPDPENTLRMSESWCLNQDFVDT